MSVFLSVILLSDFVLYLSGRKSITKSSINYLLTTILGFPFVEMFDLLKNIYARFSNFRHVGLYEVLEYESTLELTNRRGTHAKVFKRQKVRYLQDNIIAYQDQAWGDGNILQNYKCSPGKEVDRYRIGSMVQILISLQGTKQKGDINEFNIEWGIGDGFVTSTEEWSVDVSHKTKHLTTRVIFPSSRPPTNTWIIHGKTRKTKPLPPSAIVKIADGKWKVEWDIDNPKLFENYIIKWEW